MSSLPYGYSNTIHAEVHIKTDERTVVSYLTKPLQDQFARAFRER